MGKKGIKKNAQRSTPHVTHRAVEREMKILPNAPIDGHMSARDLALVIIAGHIAGGAERRWQYGAANADYIAEVATMIVDELGF